MFMRTFGLAVGHDESENPSVNMLDRNRDAPVAAL
jgi:hypothetical protein